MTERTGAGFQPTAALFRERRRDIPQRPGGICPTSGREGKERRQKGQAQGGDKNPPGISPEAFSSR